MHYLAQNHVVWRIKRENRSNGLVSGGSDEKKKEEVNIRRFWAYTSRMWGQNPLGGLSPNFFWKKISAT